MGERETIAIFSAHFLPHLGGVEVFTFELASRLALRGYEVVVVASGDGSAPERETLAVRQGEGSQAPSFEIWRLPSFGFFGGRLPFPRLGKNHRAMLAQLRERGIGRVLVNTRFYPHSLIGVELGASLGVPTVVLDHGSDYVTFSVRALDPLVRSYERLITRMIQRYRPRFYGISRASFQWLRRLGVSPEGVIPNALDGDAFRASASSRSFREELRLSSSDLIVSFVGRFVPEKGVRAIVEAAGMLSGCMPGVYFVLAGEGPLDGELRNVPSNLFVVGGLSRPDVSALLKDSDMFVFPSRSEGFGLSLLEAASWGNALVSTDVGIALDIIADGEAGAVLRAADAREIADAVMMFANDRGLLSAVSRKARQIADEEFGWDATISAVLKALS